MLRTVAGAIDCSVSSVGFLQLVRWRRKPRWLPVAKSKLFRVPERKVEDPIERAELMRLHANYKTQLRAVRGFLMTETSAREATTSTFDHLIISPDQVEADRRQYELNEKWNAEIAELRNSRLQLERDAQRQLILQRLEASKERSASRRITAEELVRVEKDRAKSLITADNIDEAIERALAETKDYNYAIDLGRNIHRDQEAV